MFSFIIPCYNELKLIKSCIKSIKSMISYDLILCEIIVVDNSDVNLSFENEIFQNIKIIKNGSNLGFGAAINKGIKIANGSLICFIDADIKVNKNYLTNVSDYFDNNRIDYLGCNVKLFLLKNTLAAKYNCLYDFNIETDINKNHYSLILN